MGLDGRAGGLEVRVMAKVVVVVKCIGKLENGRLAIGQEEREGKERKGER